MESENRNETSPLLDPSPRRWKHFSAWFLSISLVVVLASIFAMLWLIPARNGVTSKNSSNDPQIFSSSPGNFTSQSSGSWQIGSFEIRIFDVGQGDSQLIIFPSGFTILVDANEENWNSNKGAKLVSEKLEKVLGKKQIDVGVISHLHLDHLGYASYGGFWYLIEKLGWKFGKIIDRDAGKWVDLDGNGKCDPKTEIQWHNAGTFSGTATNWLCYATDPKSKLFPIRELADLCSTSQISPRDAEVQIVTADAIGAYTLNGDIISADHTQDSIPPSENDYSIGLRVQFGDIVYATFGDLDGDYATSKYGYTYNDIEAVASPRVGEVDIYRANHHGSGHSSNAKFINHLNPAVSLISCGINNSYGHPDQAVLNRLLNQGDVYLTTSCSPARNYQHSIISGDDIVIRSTDGKTFTVSTPHYQQTYQAKPNKVLPTRCPQTNLSTVFNR